MTRHGDRCNDRATLAGGGNAPRGLRLARSTAEAAAAGEPDLVDKLEMGASYNGKKFRVHPDGYNFLPFFRGEATTPPRVNATAPGNHRITIETPSDQ
jgi:hypothetical protein